MELLDPRGERIRCKGKHLLSRSWIFMASPPLSVSEQASLIEELDERQNELLDQLDALNSRLEQVLSQLQIVAVDLPLADAA